MIFAVLLSIGFAAGGGGGQPSQSPTPTPTPSPVMIGDVEPVKINSGEEAIIRIPVRVADGHRVQANPASNEFLVPLQLEIGEVDGLAFGPPVYPESEPYLLQGSEEVLKTYVGRFEVVIPVSATDGAAPGDRTVSGELHYQACNSRMCLFPSSVPVVLEIGVSPPPGDL